jgi:transcriptional regulator with XRE-family HTH domain
MTHAMSHDGEVPAWTLGDRLSRARRHAELTRGELAQKLDIGRNSVGRYESDERMPTRAVIYGWALVTGVAIGWLMGEDVGPPRRGQPVRDDDGDAPVTMQYQHDGGRHPFPGWARSPIETAA